MAGLSQHAAVVLQGCPRNGDLSQLLLAGSTFKPSPCRRVPYSPSLSQPEAAGDVQRQLRATQLLALALLHGAARDLQFIWKEVRGSVPV